MTISNMSEDEIRTALTYIDAQNRDVWVKVGTALKTEFGESGFALFDEWSSQASNYRLNDAKTAFKSFQIGKSNIGYLINQAKQNGWQREKPQGFNPDEIRQREERNAQIAQQAEIERQEKAFQAALFAQNVWKNAKTADKNHPYLQRKGITHPAVLAAIRQEKEALIIPLKNHGEIVGIQKIFADGNKRFNRDMEKKGSAFVIGNRDEMHHGFLLAEGFATAATLHQATEKPVVVAFDAGNLKEVAQNLKAFVEKHHTPVLICADKDDSQTGETKAMLAKKVLGDYAQVVLPDFSEAEIQKFQAAHNGKTPTDFNDLQAIAGIERVQNALSGCLKDDKLTLENTNESVTMDNEIPKPERSEWEKDFPKAITNGHLGNLKQDPDYQAAKAGDTDCAFNMVERLLKDETIEQMIEQFQPRRDNSVLLPVLAEENTGNNKIPLAVAQIISERTGIPCCETVFQTNHIGRTQKNADSRLLFHATFGGEVEKGKNYILIDDTLTMGGTVASLRSFVLQNGGDVSGVMVMSAQERSLQLAPTAEMIDNIRLKYGENIEEILKQELGYGLQELTNSEAAHILTYENANALRTRLAQTRYVESGETIETVGSKQELENLQIAQLTLSLRETHHPKAIIKNEPPTSLCKGEIVHIDDDFIIQRVDDNSRYFQKWNKQDLNIPTQVGDKARIYIDKQGKAQAKITKREPSQNDEIPRPPQGGFVLPVENGNTNNRLPESKNESVIMNNEIPKPENVLKPIQAKNYDNDPIRQAIQDIVIEDVKAHFALYQEEYRQHPESFGGRYICSDLFKETIPFYNRDKESRCLFNGLVHNSAAVLADKQFYDALNEIRQENDHQNKVAVFLTGSPGAGKTSSVEQGMVDHANTALIYEGQLIRPESAIDKIQAALDSGLAVKIIAVQNTPETALDNTIKRFEEIGRGSSIEAMAQIMGKTADGLDKLHQHFGNRIQLEIHERYENQPLPPQKGWENLDLLRKYGNYETTKQHLGQFLEESREAGTYSELSYNQAIGRLGRVEQKHTLSLTSALLAYAQRPRVLSDSKKQSFLNALETLAPTQTQTAVLSNSGFVLPVENSNTDNRQPENHPAKEIIMAEPDKLTPSAPLEKHTFTPDTWQPEKWQPETVQDFTLHQEELNQRQAFLDALQNQLDEKSEKAHQLDTPLKAEELAGLSKEYEQLYSMQNEVDNWRNQLDLKQSLIFANTEINHPNEENALQFDDNSREAILMQEEVVRNVSQEWNALSDEEKVQATFTLLQQKYGYTQDPSGVAMISGSKNGEAISYNAESKSLEYTALNDKGERHLVGDIEIKDLSPEYLAISLENRRLQYQQELNKNNGRTLSPEQRQQLDKSADALDEKIRQANRKTEKLVPPLAPMPPLNERYNAVERKFLDTKTNLHITSRVDYVDLNNGRTVLFADKGNKLTTSRKPDSQTIKDMVEVAKNKGWDSVKLKGSKEFKRMAFIELESQGIKAKGYSPTPEDLSMIERLREERSLNAIENTSAFRQPEKEPVLAKEQNERIEQTNTSEKQLSGSLNESTATTQQAVGGILLAHGQENYQFQKDANPSYYATIQYPDGEKTHWGKDIERLLQEQNINIGDRIELQKTGKIENVRVEEVLRDEQGEPILDENGQPQYEEVMHQRNVWEVKVYQQATNEVSGSLKNTEQSTKKQGFEQVKQNYEKAKATLSPKQQEYLAVAERLLHHAFEKGRISSHTQEYYLGNFYRHTTAEIKNGTIDIPNPYTKSAKVSKTQNINKPKTQTKGVDI